MCVEYLEKHLVDEEAKFDIPELEVRQQSQNIDPEIEMVDPIIAHYCKSAFKVALRVTIKIKVGNGFE